MFKCKFCDEVAELYKEIVLHVFVEHSKQRKEINIKMDLDSPIKKGYNLTLFDLSIRRREYGPPIWGSTYRENQE